MHYTRDTITAHALHFASNRKPFEIQPNYRTEISHQATRAGFIAIGWAEAADRETDRQGCSVVTAVRDVKCVLLLSFATFPICNYWRTSRQTCSDGGCDVKSLPARLISCRLRLQCTNRCAQSDCMTMTTASVTVTETAQQIRDRLLQATDAHSNVSNRHKPAFSK